MHTVCFRMHTVCFHGKLFPTRQKDSLAKVMDRFGKFMADNLSEHGNFIVAVTKKLNSISDRMITKFERLNTRCDLWVAPEEDDGLR